MKSLALAAVASFALANMIGVGGTASAASTTPGLVKKVTPLDIVTCFVGTYPPVYASLTKSIYGNGNITSCTPHDPTTCRTETDLQERFDNVGWVTAATGDVNYTCPADGTTFSVVEFPCKYYGATHLFRTLTIVTIVYGNVATYGAYSNEVRMNC